MKLSDIVGLVKTATGATISELYIVSTLLLGFSIGATIKAFDKEKINQSSVNLEVYRTLDSLAELSRKLYTGTDVYNNPTINTNTDTNEVSIEASNDAQFLNKSNSQKISKADKLAGMKVNLNTASKIELMKLPNIGEKTAINILEYRKNKKFLNISDIKNIKGIGEKKYQSMKEFIEVK